MMRGIPLAGFLALMLGAAAMPVAAQNSADDAGKIVQAAPQDFADWKGEEFAVGGVMDHTAFHGTLKVYGARECDLFTRRVIADGTLNPPNYDCSYLANNGVSQAAAWAEYDRLARLLHANHPGWKFKESRDNYKGDAGDPPTSTRTLDVEAPNVTVELYASNTLNALSMAINGDKGTPGYMVTLNFNSTVKAPPVNPRLQ